MNRRYNSASSRPRRRTTSGQRLQQARLRRRRTLFSGFAGLLALVLVALLIKPGHRRQPDRAQDVPVAAVLQSPEPTFAPTLTAEPAPEPTFAPTSVPTEAPTSSPERTALIPNPPEEQRPEYQPWKYGYEVYTGGKRQKSFASDALAFPEAGAYTALEGVVTFRGGNLRQNGAYGHAALASNDFKSLWSNKIGFIDSGYAQWTGVGWTGQPVLVRWPAQLRAIMNIVEPYRQQEDLVEAIYGTLDGKIYFFDARSGEYTRAPINLGYPIKGSVSIDPRGYPLLYVGQGISRINGKTGPIGWRIYSLIDQRELFFLDGRDALSMREHGSFDGACLVDGQADTVIVGGENGIFYRIRLNTAFNIDAMQISVSPEVTAYRYKSSVSREQGIENSVAAYGGYAWFADNSGLLTCLDLNAMRPVWLLDTGDDTDASIALERESDGSLALYTVNQVDKQGSKGRCTIRRVDAMTGVSDWSFSVNCTSDGDNGGGGFASPALGTGPYDDFVYFNVCRTEKGGTLYCFNKRDGAVAWSQKTGSSSWSSPVLVTREDGTGVLVVANATGRGMLRMYDPASGKKLGSLQLKGLIEGSPAVFDDLLVIGTRDCRIYGVRLR